MLFYRGRYEIPMIGVDGEPKKDVLPYGLKCQHYSARVSKGVPFLTCSAGFQEYEDQEDGSIIIDAGNDDCVPCHYFFQDGKEGAIGNARKLHIFNAILLAWFHEVPGKREKKGKPGEFWPEQEQCSGKRCVHCKEGVPKTYGRRVYVPLGPNFAYNLADYEMITLSSMCKCGGELQPVGFSCSNPECGQVIKDLEEEGCTDEELQSLREQLYRCPFCREHVELEEHSECGNCQHPEPVTMWDVALRMYRSGESVNTSLVISGVRQVTERERELIKELMVPVDINKMYPVYSLKEQASRFRIDNPYGENEKSQGAGDYDNPPSDGGYSATQPPQPEAGDEYPEDDLPF